jgi:Flp pilus assembly protein TadD
MTISPPANIQSVLAHLDAGQPDRAEAVVAGLLGEGTPAPLWGLGGVVAAALGRYRLAADRFTQAVRLAPNEPAHAANLGSALVKLGRLAEAEQLLRQVLEKHPAHPAAAATLGSALHGQGRFAQARAFLEQSLLQQPDDPALLVSSGTVAKDLGDLSTAIRHQQRALQLAPGDATARWNLAVTLLTAGHWREAWPLVEARRHHPDYALAGHPGPAWTGQPLEGRTLLVHAEQGRGDVLQLARLLPAVAAWGARLVVECQPELARLITRMPGVVQVVPRGAPLPAYDYQCAMMSLCGPLGVEPDKVPGPAIWLSADPAEQAAWADRLEGPGLRVGLCWAGQPANPVDVRRSIDLALLHPLAAVPGVRFVCLQKGPAAAQAADWPGGMLQADLPDFAATAALVANLDLVISVDTAVVHLAGGLGRPVWLLNRFDGCWRWLKDRPDSGWYPGLRQFRQRVAGDWSYPVSLLAARLRALASR